MIGHRDPVTGNPTGLRPVGNVSDLKITVNTTVVNHKDSQDGQRAIDARLQTETNATASLTLDNWIADNLAKALRGSHAVVPAGTVTGLAVNGFFGLVTGFPHIRVSNVVVKLATTTLTEYVDAVTPYDYKLNEDSGSIMLNDPLVTGVALGHLTETVVVPTVIAEGSSTVLTVAAPGGTKVGDEVALSGFTGAGAGVLNGVKTAITAIGTGTIEVDINTSGLTLAAGGVQFIDTPQVLTVSYSYAAQQLVDSLTAGLPENWLRFEGLNTADNNSPVVVDIFRFSNDPLKELALISDAFGQFVLEGSVLKDKTRPAGVSNYFQVRKLN
jgi:hypothetical protein